MQADSEIYTNVQNSQNVITEQEQRSDVRNINNNEVINNDVNTSVQFHGQLVDQNKSQIINQPQKSVKTNKIGIICGLLLLICLAISSIMALMQYSNIGEIQQRQKIPKGIQDKQAVSDKTMQRIQEQKNTKNKQTVLQNVPSRSIDSLTTTDQTKQQTRNENQSTGTSTQAKQVINVVQDNPKLKILNFLSSLRDAPKLHDIWKVTKFNQLPFCIFTSLPIEPSLSNQNYSNYITLPFPTSTSESLILSSQKCKNGSVIMFLKQPIQNTNFLMNLNQIHQSFNTWATYIHENNTFQVVSFYGRILELVQNNDFDLSRKKFYDGQMMKEYLGLAIIQLCQLHVRKIDTTQIGDVRSYLSFNTDLWQQDTAYLKVKPYDRIYKLTQDYPVDMAIEQERYSNLKKLKSNGPNQLNPQKIYKAIERQQMLYLPQNHSLFQLQCIQNDCDQQKSENQVRFCVTVLSHDNTNQSRYKKVMQSIIQQKYLNYHIVFIDDFSSDANMEMTMKYVKEAGFPKQRIRFIQNNQRKYATYNIINAAFTYCKPEEIQLLVDGDDQIIGTQAFQILSSVYHKKPQKWVVYSTFKGNLYTYGTSKYLRNMNIIVNTMTNTRRGGHYIGPIRTWRVQLLYNIPLSYHFNQKGKWLDTLYDDAIQYCLVELSGINRIQYIPQIMYEYNMQYGDNDNSNDEKRSNRKATYRWVLAMKPLKRLQTLDGSIPDKQITQIFQKQKNIKFYQKQLINQK